MQTRLTAFVASTLAVCTEAASMSMYGAMPHRQEESFTHNVVPVKDTADKYASLRSQSTFSRKKSINEKFSDMIFGKSIEETAFAAQVDAHLQKTRKTKYGKGRLGEAYLPLENYEETYELFGAKIYLPD